MRPQLLRKASSHIWAMVLATSIVPSLCFAWGHWKGVDSKKWGYAYLAYRAIDQGKIRFCVENRHPEYYSTRSLTAQIQIALTMWVKAGTEHPVLVEEVKCSSNQGDLIVDIGPQEKWDFKTNAISTLVRRDSQYKALIKIHTRYFDATPLDFLELMDRDFEKMVQVLMNSQSSALTSERLTEMTGLRSFAFHNSTFRILLHEVGHSFALCDTYRSSETPDCDPNFTALTQVPGVMGEYNFYHLNNDDIESIRRMFERTRNKLTAKR